MKIPPPTEPPTPVQTTRITAIASRNMEEKILALSHPQSRHPLGNRSWVFVDGKMRYVAEEIK